MNCGAMAASGHSLKCFLLSLFLNLDSHIGEGEISFFFTRNVSQPESERLFTFTFHYFILL